MRRDQKVLKYINKLGQGVEIGPSHRPIAPKKQGYKVQIIDHMNREELIKKYEEHNIDLDSIEEVDFVWNGESYSKLTGKQNFYDWIIASHVIEHAPNLIGFINDCDQILKTDGVLSLAIPDKRYCFDHFRPITGLSKIIDSHFRNHTVHTAGTVAEYYLNVSARGDSIAWHPSATEEYRLLHSLSDAQNGINIVETQGAYIDVHAWCFTPHSFRLIIQDLNSLGLISLNEVGFYPTEGCEFFVTLGRQGEGTKMPRLQLLKTIELELSNI